MKKLWIEIQNSGSIIFSKQFDLEPLKEKSWIFVRILIRFILSNVKGYGKVIISAIRSCIFQILHIIASGKNMKDATYVSAEKGLVKVTARLTDGKEV